jgi:hypothetical protein
MDIWSNLLPFGIVCDDLVYFSCFGMFGPRKISQPCTRAWFEIYILFENRAGLLMALFVFFAELAVSLLITGLTPRVTTYVQSFVLLGLNSEICRKLLPLVAKQSLSTSFENEPSMTKILYTCITHCFPLTLYVVGYKGFLKMVPM